MWFMWYTYIAYVFLPNNTSEKGEYHSQSQSPVQIR